MRKEQGSHVRWLAWASLVLLTCLGVSPRAWADEPMLAVRLIGGESRIYAVSSVERILFEDTALVVVTGDGAESYEAETIKKVEFLWEFSGVHDPRGTAALLKAVHLFQNQPNPFSPETRIAFDLPQTGPLELMIYGVNGRLIRRLVKDTRQAGRYTANWDGRDDAGKKAGSGIYFYQLTAPGVEESRQMILLP
jgi:hypothetical protein